VVQRKALMIVSQPLNNKMIIFIILRVLKMKKNS